MVPNQYLRCRLLLGKMVQMIMAYNWGTSQNVRQGGATNDWNLGWGWNTPTDNLVTAWDNTDPRKAMTILYSGQYDGGRHREDMELHYLLIIRYCIRSDILE